MHLIKDAVILSAGNNKRLQNLRLTKLLPKSMIPILGKPVLEYILNFLVSNGVENVYIVVNNKKDTIIDYFENGTDFGIHISYIVQETLNGIAMGLNLVKDYLHSRFICILGDTFVIEQDISHMIELSNNKDAIVVEAIANESDKEKIRQACSVVIDNNNKILNIVEKPQNPQNNIRGSGIYVFTTDIFNYISKTQKNPITGELDITDTIKLVADLGKAYGEWLFPNDVNINVPNDIIFATKLALKYTVNNYEQNI